MNFTSSPHCLSGAHCGTCRDLAGGRAFRTLLAQAFALPPGAPDFECPHGKPWGHVPDKRPVVDRVPSPARAAASTKLDAPGRQGGGAGTEIAAMLAEVGFVAFAGCKCNRLKALWDERGPDWCEANATSLIAELGEAARAAGHPVETDDDRTAIAALVATAIANARKPA